MRQLSSRTISEDILEQIYPERSAAAHKGNFGHLLVIGGSMMYSGSPAFNALAAYRVGVDLVTVVAPHRAANIIVSFSPDLITYPVEGDFFTPDHLGEIETLSEGTDAIVIGGGMGRNEETMEFVQRVFARIDKPFVVDADAFYALEEHEARQQIAEVDFFEGKASILTPHAHEFEVLMGQRLNEATNQQVSQIEDAASAMESVILQKGNPDIISDGASTRVNQTGNPYMTVGGTGDTLAGICGAYLAMGLDPYTVACAAAFVNGKAGDLAAANLGPSLMASDLLAYLPQAIQTSR
ncbi:MAG: NAD(P)H-hydrate dehydratase [Patescibacteria group bacterium]